MSNCVQVIERIDRLSPEQFHREYVRKNRPVIITGVVDRWTARSVWTPEYFQSAFPHVPITYETWKADATGHDPVAFFAEKQTFLQAPMAEFVSKMGSADDPHRKCYCAGFPIFKAIPELLGDTESVDVYRDVPRHYPRAVREVLKLPPFLFLGPAGVLTSLHFDRWYSVFAQIYGRKKWIMIPPEQSRYVYFPCSGMSSVVVHYSPVDAEHPDLDRFPLFTKVTPIEFVLEPGEMLFVPAGWWHHVNSLDTSIAIDFPWVSPRASVVALRRYLYVLLRRAVLRGLGMRKLILLLEA